MNTGTINNLWRMVIYVSKYETSVLPQEFKSEIGLILISISFMHGGNEKKKEKQFKQLKL